MLKLETGLVHGCSPRRGQSRGGCKTNRSGVCVALWRSQQPAGTQCDSISLVTQWHELPSCSPLTTKEPCGSLPAGQGSGAGGGGSSCGLDETCNLEGNRSQLAQYIAAHNFAAHNMQAVPSRAASAPAAGAARRRHIAVSCTSSDVTKPQVQQLQQQRQQQAAGSRRAVLGLGAALLAAQIAPARAEEPLSVAEETEVGWGPWRRCRRQRPTRICKSPTSARLALGRHTFRCFIFT